MSELEMPCPLGAARDWDRQDYRGNPLPDNRRGFDQPDTVEVKRIVAPGERESVAKIVPDSGCNGIEWSMCYTMQQFMANIFVAWALSTAHNTGMLMFQYWRKCLREKALAIWEAVELVHFSTEVLKTEDNFKRGYVYYLEKIAKMTYIGNSIIHRVLNWRKSVVMSTQDYSDRIMLMLSYLDAAKGYVRYSHPLPTAQQIQDAVYRAHPKNQRLEFGKLHKRADMPIQDIIEHFENFALSDRHDGKEQTAQALYWKNLSIERAKAQGQERPRSNATNQADHNGGRPRAPRLEAQGRSDRASSSSNQPQRSHGSRNYPSSSSRDDRGRRGSERQVVPYRPNRDQGRNDRDQGRSSHRGNDRSYQGSGPNSGRDPGRAYGSQRSGERRGGERRGGERDAHAVHFEDRSRSRSRSPRRTRSPSRSRSPPPRSRTPSPERKQSADSEMHHYDDHDEEVYALQDNTMPDTSDRETPRDKRMREKLIIDRARQEKYSSSLALEDQELKAYQAFIRANTTSQLSFPDYQEQERIIQRRAPTMRHKKNARWKLEQEREPREEVDGRPVGFGSWYQRSYHDYTKEELRAPQSSADRIRTRDCKPADQIYRDEHDDDSHNDSDWFDRTSYECYYKRVSRDKRNWSKGGRRI